MVTWNGSGLDLPKVRLGEIEPPGNMTDAAHRAIKEGLMEVFWPDIDGQGTKGVVVLPHRLHVTYVCSRCPKSVIVELFSKDAINGNIAVSRRCECGKSMYRRNIGPKMDVPLEVDKSDKKTGLENYTS